MTASATAVRAPARRAARLGRLLWPWTRTLLALAILAVLVQRLGTAAFLDGLRLVTVPAVAAGLGIGLLTTVCSVLRWRLVARRLGLPLPLGTALADYYRALFLNAVLPAGVLGDAERALRHGRSSGDLGRSVRAVVLERAGGQAVLVVAGAAALLAEPSPAVALLGGLSLSAVTAAALLSAGALLAWAAWLPRRRPAGGAVAAGLAAAVADARRGLLGRDAWPGVLGLSAAALLGHVALFLVAARTAGVAAPVGTLLPLILPTLLVMALPVNVGGWGPREAFAATAFGAAGLGAEQGLTTAVVYGVLAFAASLPGAVVLLARCVPPPVCGRAFQERTTARTSANDSTRLPTAASPFAALASEGLPMTPDSVYAAMPRVSRCLRSSLTRSAVS